MDTNLQDLVARAMRGDRQAYQSLCEAKARDVLYICTKITGDLTDGEDAAQEVFVQMQTGIRRLKDPVAFPAWLNRVISHTCSNLKRKGYKQLLLPLDEKVVEFVEEADIEFLPQELAEHKEGRRAVLEALDTLPVHYRQALVLFYFDGMSLKELAAIRGTEVKQVQNLLFRARKALKKELDGRHVGVRTLGAAAPLAAGGAATLTRILQHEAMTLLTPQSIATVASAGAAAAASAAKLALAASLARVCLPLLAVAAIAGSVVFGNQTRPAAALVSSAPAPLGTVAPPEQPPAGSTPEPPVSESPSPPVLSAPDHHSEAPAPAVGEAAASLEVRGQLAFLTREGTEVAGMAHYAAGMTVSAQQNGQTIATATVDSSGGYRLSLPAGAYTLRLHGVTSFAAAKPPASAEVSAAGQQLPTLYFTDTQAPSGSIRFEGDGGTDLNGSSVNPTSAQLVAVDATPTTTRWQVQDAAGNTLHRGEGEYVPLAELGLAASYEGVAYTLHFTTQDAANNTTETTRPLVYIG